MDNDNITTHMLTILHTSTVVLHQEAVIFRRLLLNQTMSFRKPVNRLWFIILHHLPFQVSIQDIISIYVMNILKKMSHHHHKLSLCYASGSYRKFHHSNSNSSQHSCPSPSILIPSFPSFIHNPIQYLTND